MHYRACNVMSAVAIVLAAGLSELLAAPPRVANDRYQLELVAREPDIVTPTGLAFDRQGRLLIIESNTHQRPKDYDGPLTDRILMLAPPPGGTKLDHWNQ